MSTPSSFQNISLPPTPRFKRLRDVEDDASSSSYTGTSRSVLTGDNSDGTSHADRRKKRRKTKKELFAEGEVGELIRRFDKLRYVARAVPYRALDRQPILADPDPVMVEYMKTHPEVRIPCDPAEWVFVKANSVVELNHLDRFNRTYTDLTMEHMPAVTLAAGHVEDLLRLPAAIAFPTIDDLDKVRFQGDKFAGVEYAQIGMKSRREAHERGLLDAREAWEKLMRGEAVTPQLNRIGGRGKLTTKKKFEASGEKPTAGRLIFMTGHRDLLLNGVTEQLLTNAYRPDEYPVSVGNSWWHDGCRRFFERFKKWELFHCFDAAKFDSSLPPWLIKISLNILRSAFSDAWNPKYDAYWEFVFQGLVYAPVYLDNGLMFIRNGGSTSGHSFNTLMQSICTLVMIYACMIELLGADRAEEVFKNMWAEGLGDDQHTGMSGPLVKYDIDDIAPVALAIAGIDWTGDKSFNTGRLVDTKLGDFQGTQYLGKYFRILDEDVGGIRAQGVVPYRPFDETFLRLYYPERGDQGWTDAWMRAIGHYADGAGNPETREFLEGYLDWLEDKVESDKFEWDEKWKRKFNNHDLNRAVPVPSRRISYEDWLGLVLIDPSVED
uniref:RNA-dependent RNA polymerase n=1 Tax=Heterobasidion RNA virus 6 TaxID=980634 RepID=V5N4D8_9VIRU|nr:RNA-dependent RNA polymerase [Heterobasidion RNA virus 6]